MIGYFDGTDIIHGDTLNAVGGGEGQQLWLRLRGDFGDEMLQLVTCERLDDIINRVDILAVKNEFIIVTDKRNRRVRVMFPNLLCKRHPIHARA